MIDSTEQNLVEPCFKYTRYISYAADIISKDTISCLAVHSKFIVLGTEWGNIHILDHMGNPSSKKEIHAHSTTINEISIDDSGEYIASCSNDGKVMVFGLLDDKQYPVLTFNQAIYAVAISPEFKRTFQFITGDTRLLLASKGILSTQKHKVLQENKTLIRNIKWKNNIVIYATNDSVFVFDMKEQRLIGIIDPTNIHSVSNEKDFYCRISWIDDENFIIGWGHLIQVCTIKEKASMATSLNPLDYATTGKLNASNKKVECMHYIKHTDRILGVVPYNSNILTIVDSIEDDKTKEDVKENQLIVIVIKPSNESPNGYFEIATDQIIPKCSNASKQYKINLEKIPYENQFYIVSSKDLISVKEFDIDDRIKWLINKNCYERALKIVNETDPSSTKYNRKDVGMSYINYLIGVKKYSEASILCSSILDDAITWQNIVNMFLENSLIKFILPYIPYNGSIILDQETYKNMLINCFCYDLDTFLHLLKTWPSHLYNIHDIIDVILKDAERSKELTHLDSKRSRMIIECLGILYENNLEFDKALEYYLKLKSDYIFQLIPKRNMFYIVNSDKLIYLITLNKDRTLRLLMDYLNEVLPENVCKILSPTPFWLFHYLNELINHNKAASEPYHSRMVILYAEFKRDSLLTFLRSSDKYDLNAAIKFCQSKGFSKEVIHLLGRVGRSKEALQMIMEERSGEIEAIEYCHERDDPDLWQQLTLFSIDKPIFIKAILENTAMDVDIKSFIRKIRNDINIPELKDSLVKLLINYEKRNNLIISHQLAKWNDIFEMINQRLDFTSRPIICDLPEKNKCTICFRSIVNSMNSLILFRCSHICHKLCLKDNGGKLITLCSFCIGA